MGCKGCRALHHRPWPMAEELIAAERMKAGAQQRCGICCGNQKLKCYSRKCQGAALFGMMMVCIMFGPLLGGNASTLGGFGRTIGKTSATCTTVSSGIVGTTVCDGGSTMPCLQVNVSYPTPSGDVTAYLMGKHQTINSNQPCMVYEGSCSDGTSKVQEYTTKYGTPNTAFQCSYNNANVDQVMLGYEIGYIIGGSFIIAIAVLMFIAFIVLNALGCCCWGYRYMAATPPADITEEARQRFPNGYNPEVDGKAWTA